MAAADAAACGKRDRLDRHMAAAAPVGAPAGTRFLPFVFEVHGGCTGDTAREIRHLLNAWSEQNGYDETRCAVNRHAWRYYIAAATSRHSSRGMIVRFFLLSVFQCRTERVSTIGFGCQEVQLVRTSVGLSECVVGA